MLNKETLYNLYIIEKKPGIEIAKIANVKSAETIYNWLKKYDIPRRDGREAQNCYEPTKEELHELYIVQELSIDKIWRLVGSSESSISKLLDKYDIPKRSNTEKYGGWNKGIPLPLQQKKHLSEIAKQRTGENAARFGAVLSKETKEKISNSLKGRFRKHQNPNWKNGGTTKYRQVWQGRFEYHEWRISVFVRDNYTCQECGKPSNGDIQAHHITPVHKDPSKILDSNNGITLCEKCHLSIKGNEHKYVDKYKNIIRQSTP